MELELELKLILKKVYPKLTLIKSKQPNEILTL